MSKKPKRSRHRIPSVALEFRSEPISERYQAEVDSSMARLERAYRKAEAALEAAERRAERSREQAERLAAKQAEAARIAANRLAEEARLTEYIEAIRLAAQKARVESARAEQERKRREVTERRNAVTALRRAEAKASREREQQLARVRADSISLELLVEERRRELREIERLMMPGSYNNRDSRRAAARHQAG